ncbi:uncharacterized protein TRIVIDRAFT_164757 [Trichoderma virens Gv29-8]|uniref:Kinetochore protein fta7 n=1 Tax=Hypocrea virens (strain Gv29-8 / FGSC 10586) TaxID=413071 RepID=G9NCU1_HYPVG|nr:uncharacterized protein TRIVIDRAFT_164757 [Trichoderma virens Gv29-8]EHK15513.1 hypothetical protein TRIVIDRAFT_164757 [Trichoderma virens Gv29-8]
MRPKKRGRPRKSVGSPDDEASPAPESSKVAKKRGRPSLGGKARDLGQMHVHQDEATPPQQKRKRGRPSLKSREPEDEETPRRGRPRYSEDTESQTSLQSSGAAQESDEDQLQNETPNLKQLPAKRKRGRPSLQARREEEETPEHDDDVPPSPSKPYPHISPHINRVRQSTIESKWSPLPDSTVSAASSMLALAHRPILQRLSTSEQHHTHTSAALRLVSHRITRKIARGIPFPPASMPSARVPRGRQAGIVPGAAGVSDGRATELDFESVLDAKTALERQLDPALHAVELLAREKEKLERELERDYEALRNLENSAKAQGREYRGLLKKAHVLAPTPETVHSQRKQKAEQDMSFTHSTGSLSGGLFSDLQDPELKSLALQLSDHMESIKSNLQQADGIVPQLARSRAALQDVLFRQLSQEQYERVVLG